MFAGEENERFFVLSLAQQALAGPAGGWDWHGCQSHQTACTCGRPERRLGV